MRSPPTAYRLAGTAPETVAGWLGALPEEVRERPLLRLLAGRLAMGGGRVRAGGRAMRGRGRRARARGGSGDGEVGRRGSPSPRPRSPPSTSTAAGEASAGADDRRSRRRARARSSARSPTRPCSPASAAARSPERPRSGACARAAAGSCSAGARGLSRVLRDLPAGRLDDALEQDRRRRCRALRAADNFNRLPYVLAFKMAVHEARGELEQALETFEALLEAARRTGLAGYIGAGARLAAATMLALLGRPEEARVQLERVDRDWSSWVGVRPARGPRDAGRAGDGSPPTAVAQGRRAIEEARRMPAVRSRPRGGVLAPVLCDAGHRRSRRDALEGVLEALGPDESRARTRAALACVLHGLGERAAAHEALAAAFDEAGASGALHAPQRVAAGRPRALERARGRGDRRRARDRGPRRRISRRRRRSSPSRAPAIRRCATRACSPRRPPAARGARPPRRTRRRPRRAAGAGARAADPASAAARVPDARSVRGPPWRLARRAGAWERKVAERVVRLLLVRGGELVPEDELFEAFWPDKTPRLGAPRSADRDLERPRRPRPALGAEPRCESRSAPTRSSLRDGDSFDAAAFEAAAEPGARRSRARSGSRGWRPPRGSGAASRCPRSATRTGRPPGASG